MKTRQQRALTLYKSLLDLGVGFSVRGGIVEALFIAMQEGRITIDEFTMLLIRRCKFVASERKHDGQRGRAGATGRRKTA